MPSSDHIGLHVDAVVLAQPRLDGHRPRRVDAAAERA